MSEQTLSAAMFKAPAILLSGAVDYEMYANFRRQLDASPSEGLVVIELSTLGGDPEVARMMGEDIRSTATCRPSGVSSSWARRPSIRRARPS